MKRILIMMLATATVAVFATNAFAQQPLEYNVVVKVEVVKGSPGDHFLTFNTPVTIPDGTLAPGTYIFSILGSSAIQVRTADRSEPLAMFFTTPIRRAE